MSSPLSLSLSVCLSFSLSFSTTKTVAKAFVTTLYIILDSLLHHRRVEISLSLFLSLSQWRRQSQRRTSRLLMHDKTQALVHTPYLCVCCDSFMRVSWLIHVCVREHATWVCVSWLIRMCVLTHLYVCPVSVIRVAWRVTLFTHVCISPRLECRLSETANTEGANKLWRMHICAITPHLQYTIHSPTYNTGMSGTANTELKEFSDIYNLPVTCIPTALPVARRDNPDAVFRTQVFGMCMCMRVHVCVRMCVYFCVFMCICLGWFVTCPMPSSALRSFACVSVCVCMCACVWVYVFVFVCVCMHQSVAYHTCTRTHTNMYIFWLVACGRMESVRQWWATLLGIYMYMISKYTPNIYAHMHIFWYVVCDGTASGRWSWATLLGICVHVICMYIHAHTHTHTHKRAHAHTHVCTC